MIIRAFSLYVFLFSTLALSSAPKIKTQGRFLLDGEGKKLILRGVNIPDPEHLNNKKRLWPNTEAEKLILMAIDQFNANLIRIPVHPESDGVTGFFNNPKGYVKNYLDPVVNLCIEKGVYIIIDLHFVADYEDKKQMVLKFWEIVAERYKNKTNVIFEIFNEPIRPDNWDFWKNHTVTPTVNLIRSVAKENLIIVTSPYWNSHLEGILRNPIKGKNIAYSAHIYPNQFKNPKWNETYQKVADLYPLLITEWGYDMKAYDPIVRGTTSEFGRPLLNWMEKNELSWTAWIFDHLWTPKMFNWEWELKGGEEGMGVLVAKGLQKNK